MFTTFSNFAEDFIQSRRWPGGTKNGSNLLLFLLLSVPMLVLCRLLFSFYGPMLLQSLLRCLTEKAVIFIIQCLSKNHFK